MTLSNFLPLLVALALCSPILVARRHDGVDRALTRVSIQAFGGYVDEFKSEHPQRQAALRAARFPTTYREYGSKTYLYAGLLAAAGSILGMYVIWGLLLVLSIDPGTMRESLPVALEFVANVGGVPTLSLFELFTVMLLSCLTVGIAAGGGAYWLRWWYPSYVADNRSRRIEATLPLTVAFVHALSRSGMDFPKVIRIVAAHGETYGDAAAEFDVAVRNMDTFGMDVITALQTMGRRTPSPQLQEFTENLVSVLQSGHSVSEFLEQQYHEYQEEAEAQQENMLELLSTLAEAYVTVLVAGPLFLITILVVIGISVSETITPLQALIYIILPFGNLAFIIYLSMVTDAINPGRQVPTRSRRSGPTNPSIRQTRADGGFEGVSPDGVTASNVERLRYYRRLKTVRERFGDPIRALLDRPERLLYVTIPLAVLVIAWRVPTAFAGDEFDPTVIDDTIALAVLFVVATYGLVYELHRRRIDAIESSIPDFLDRLSSVNRAGMPIITAIDYVRDSDLGALDAELQRIWADVQWGADLETALFRFGARVRTRATSRVVTLLTEAMNASGNLSTVLRIAARQAAADRRLKRERKQSMLEYMVVVYISFLVFLFIITVFAAYLLPNLYGGAGVADGAEAAAEVEGLAGIADIDLDAYSTLFYHATLIQGLLSGLIAGQLSTGDIRAGAKHAAFMLTVAILLFAVLT